MECKKCGSVDDRCLSPQDWNEPCNSKPTFSDKLKCFFSGHDFAQSIKYEDERSLVYRYTCKRCNLRLISDYY